MNGARFVLCCVIGWCLTVNLEASRSHADLEESKRNGSSSRIDVAGDSTEDSTFLFEPIDGFKVGYSNDELSLHYDAGNSMESRHKDEENKRRTIMKKIGRFLMMIPIGLQLLQIPLAIASVKMSLIRSLLVAKVALFMLLIRLLFSPKPQEKIVIIKTPKEYHDHFYHHHPYEELEDDKPGWLGKGPSWLY